MAGRRLCGSLAVVAMLSWAGAGTGQDKVEGEDKVKEVVQGLLPYFAATPGKDLGDRFADSFLKAVPAQDLEKAFQTLHKNCGRATEVRLVKMTGPYAAQVEFVFEKGFLVPAALSLEAKSPYKIVAFVSQGAIKENDSADAIIDEMKELPGTAAFTVMRLGKQPRVIWEHKGDTPMAVASSFKLMVYAALVEQIRKGERSWGDVTFVRKEWASLPGGFVQDWPDLAPITVHTLATLMISKSDNTAADHLIHLLGRERIEKTQEAVGIKAPERNRPFLTTGDMFKIKYVLTPEQQKAYLTAKPDERRKQLETLVKTTSLSQPKKFGTPQLIDEVEWFFSTEDMCRIMDWLRRQDVPQARGILAINEGLPLDRGFWTYVGYKAGAEPGVLNLTFLLQTKPGDWYACSATWNHPQGPVDTTRLLALAQRLIRLTQKQAAR